MSIDWFTVAAQALNFLILLWLMKRFLFKPIMKAIDGREKAIADDLADAKAKMDAVQKQKEEYEAKTADISQQSASILKKAQDDGKSEKLHMLQTAREEADALSVKKEESLITEEAALRKAVSMRIQNEVLITARKVLKDLAGASLEEQLVLLFIRRLQELSVEQKEAFVTALDTAATAVIIRSALALSLEQQNSLDASLKELFGIKTQPEFDLSSSLILGIELSIGGLKVAWSVEDYLATIEEGIQDLLKASSK